MTALNFAAYDREADIVSLLLAAGADIEARDIVSKRISICLVSISEKCRYVLFLYFILVICRIR